MNLGFPRKSSFCIFSNLQKNFRQLKKYHNRNVYNFLCISWKLKNKKCLFGHLKTYSSFTLPRSYLSYIIMVLETCTAQPSHDVFSQTCSTQRSQSLWPVTFLKSVQATSASRACQCHWRSHFSALRALRCTKRSSVCWSSSFEFNVRFLSWLLGNKQSNLPSLAATRPRPTHTGSVLSAWCWRWRGLGLFKSLLEEIISVQASNIAMILPIAGMAMLFPAKRLSWMSLTTQKAAGKQLAMMMAHRAMTVIDWWWIGWRKTQHNNIFKLQSQITD